jgi:hypothetical protein
MANYITDQKGRLLTTVFPAYRGDASIGGQEVIEVTVDLSLIGTGTTTANLGVQSTLPNAGVGLIAADSIDIATLPYNFQVQSVQFMYDLNAPTPDILPAGNLTGLTGLTYSLGRFAVSAADRATAITVAGFTAAATTYANAATLTASSAFTQPSLIYTAGTDYLPYNTPGVNASAVTGTINPVYVLRFTVGTLTGGSSTGVKSGRFRFRIGGIAYGT